MIGRIRSPKIYWLIGVLLLISLLTAACQPLQAPSAVEAEPPETMAEEQDAEITSLMGDAEAGAYIFNATRGCGCHFNRDLGALAGGNAFEGDFGVVVASNLTSDEETGIGAVSDQQIADAIRFGTAIPREGRSEGETLFIMPRYPTMADQDVADLVAHLRTLESVTNQIPDRELNFEPATFEPQQAPPAVAPSEGVDRGRYLAALARCGQCHTPSNEDGSPNMDLLLAGAPFRDTVAPNLTPDENTGLGAWSEEEIVDFLKTGIYSDGTEAHQGMKGLSERNLSKMTDEDVQAIAQFLQSLPPVENLP